MELNLIKPSHQMDKHKAYLLETHRVMDILTTGLWLMVMTADSGYDQTYSTATFSSALYPYAGF